MRYLMGAALLLLAACGEDDPAPVHPGTLCPAENPDCLPEETDPRTR